MRKAGEGGAYLEDRSAGSAQLGDLDLERRDNPGARARSGARAVGAIGFTEYFWLLVTGGLPSPAQRRVLDATLVAIAEHGLVPSVQAARMTLTAAPEALQGAVAAGLLGCGSTVFGSSEAAGRFFAEIQVRAAQGASLEDAATAVVREYREAKRAIPG